MSAPLLLLLLLLLPGGESLGEAMSASRLRDRLPPQVSEQAAHPLAQGTFVQSKFLKGLQQPVQSEGDFVFSRERGLLWRTRAPFESELVITSGGVSVRDGGGTTRMLAGGDQPGVQAATWIFFALFSLDFEALGRDFRLYSLGDDARWEIALEPRSSATGQLFERALMSGSAQGIERIELAEHNGDRTEIRFADVSFPDSLDASQLARFTAR